jgi:UDP-3-O-[3-hydroxymyristoyl] glucosamine N-acyltransferase
MRLSEVAKRVGGTLDGDDVEVRGIAGIDAAGPGDLTFLDNPRYLALLAESKAAAVIVGRDAQTGGKPAVRVASPRIAFAIALEAFHPPVRPPVGVHPTAVVAPSARLGPGASVGAHVVIEDGVTIGKDATLFPHAVVRRDVTIGDDFRAHSHVVVRERCRIGNRVILQDGVVIGADGFGFAPRPDGSHHKIPHVGIVVIEDDVEVQANASVDRASVGETRVRRGTKIDSLVQVGHSVDVGEDSLLCALVGVGGSTRIGKGVTLAGQVGVADHTRVGEGVTVFARSGIHGDIAPGSTIAGSPHMDYRLWLRATGVFARLGDLAKEVKALRAELDALRRRVPD